jgi:hypothetical protein
MILSKSSHRVDRTDLIALAYIIWMGIAVQWSSLVENSFYYFWILSGLPLTYLIVRRLEPEGWRQMLWYLAIPAAFSAIWGIGEFVMTKHRANGPLIDPNAWAALHNIFFFAVLSQYLVEEKKPAGLRYSREFLMLLFVVAMFCAYSRGATVVWLVAFSFVVLVSWIAGLDRKKIATAILIAMLGFSLVHGYVSQSEASHHDEGYTLDLQDTAWSQRFAIWNAAWNIYLDNPITGSGIATFKVQYPAYRTTGDLTNTGNHVHNDYLQFLQEGGPVQLSFLLGLVLFLVARLLIVTVTLLRERIRSPLKNMSLSSEISPDRASVEVLVLIVAVGTSFAHGLINFNLALSCIQIGIGFLLARILYLLSKEKVLTKVMKFNRTGPALLISVVWGFWVILVIDGLTSALIYDHRGIPGANWIKKDAPRYFDTLYWLTKFRSGNSSNHFALATLYRQAMDQQSDPAAINSLAIAAASEYRYGLQLNPYSFAIQIYYADLLEYNPGLYNFFPDELTPEQILETALELNPTHLSLYVELARHYQQSGRDHEAYLLLKNQALPWLDLSYDNFNMARTRYIKQLVRLAVKFEDAALIQSLDAEIQLLKSGA